jgi:hypothetical protein
MYLRNGVIFLRLRAKKKFFRKNNYTKKMSLTIANKLLLFVSILGLLRVID